MKCKDCEAKQRCKYCATHAQAQVDGGNTRLLKQPNCYPHLRAPSAQKKSFFDTCQEEGKRVTTKKNNVCAHSVDCSRKIYDAGVKGHGPRGWKFISPECMERPESYKQKHPGLKKSSTKKKASTKKTASTKKKKALCASTVGTSRPATCASTHELHERVVGRDRKTMYSVENKMSRRDKDGKQSEYKFYKRI